MLIYENVLFPFSISGVRVWTQLLYWTPMNNSQSDFALLLLLLLISNAIQCEWGRSNDIHKYKTDGSIQVITHWIIYFKRILDSSPTFSILLLLLFVRSMRFQFFFALFSNWIASAVCLWQFAYTHAYRSFHYVNAFSIWGSSWNSIVKRLRKRASRATNQPKNQDWMDWNIEWKT